MRPITSRDHHLASDAQELQRAVREFLGQLARKGLAPSREAIAEEAGFPVFSVPDDAQPITPEMVRRAEEPEI